MRKSGSSSELGGVLRAAGAAAPCEAFSAREHGILLTALIQHIYIIVLHKGDCKIDGSRLRVCRPLEDLRAPLRMENKQKS